MKKLPKLWKRYLASGYLAHEMLQLLWREYDALERAFLAHMMIKFSLLVPMRPEKGSSSSSAAGVQQYLVPTMTKPPKQPPSMLPDPSRPTAYLAFGEEPDGMVCHDQIWRLGGGAAANAEFQLGFQPPALLPRLQAKIVAWGQHLGGSLPNICRGALEVHCGALHFKLEQLPNCTCGRGSPAAGCDCDGLPCLRLTLLAEKQFGAAHIVLSRLLEMVREIQRECMPKLECFAALPVPQLDAAELTAAARGKGELHLVPLSRVRRARRTAQAITSSAGLTLDQAQFARWQKPPPSPLDWYHVAISYRQATEKPFTAQLFDALAQFEAAKGQRIRVFLDQERLQDGQRWELTIVKAMLHTFIFVPIVSAGSVGGMAQRFEAAPAKVDYVLLEWMLALELHERGVIKRIYPLVLGDEDVGGGAGADEGARAQRSNMSNFMTDGHIARVPDEVMVPTCEKLDALLAEMGEPPLLSARPTARQVVERMVREFQHVNVRDLEATHGRADQPVLGWGLHEECAKGITKVLQQVEAEHGSMAEMGEKSAKIAELEERARTAKSAGERSAAEAEAGRVEELLLRLLAGQGRIEHKIDENFLAIQASFGAARAGTAGVAESLCALTALTEGLLADEHTCPGLVWLSPKTEQASGLFGRLRAWGPANWFSDTMVVHFLCPYTLAIVGCGPGGEGYEIKQAKAWVKAHAKLVGSGVFVVRVALAGGRAVGVPLPGLSLADVVPGTGGAIAAMQQQQTAALRELAEKSNLDGEAPAAGADVQTQAQPVKMSGADFTAFKVSCCCCCCCCCC